MKRSSKGAPTFCSTTHRNTPRPAAHAACALCATAKIAAAFASSEGAPLSAEACRKIFERFYRLERSRDGSYGLGLSIAESIVRRTGGRIWAESAAHENRFFIELPLCKSAPAAP